MSLRKQTFGFSFLWAIFYSEKRGYIGATHVEGIVEWLEVKPSSV